MNKHQIQKNICFNCIDINMNRLDGRRWRKKLIRRTTFAGCNCVIVKKDKCQYEMEHMIVESKCT